MAAFRSLITILPNPQGELIHPLALAALTSVRKRDGRTREMGRHPEAFFRRLAAAFRECWRLMRIMSTAFEHAESGDGDRCRDQSDERVLDEKGCSRMDDEGCAESS